MVKISKLLKLDYRIVLASKSPRRIKLLSDLGFDFEVMPADIDEDISSELLPNVYVEHLATLKAETIAHSLDYPALVIGSDTTVVLDCEYLNKPNDAREAFEILRKLSGRTHEVFTGIALVSSDGKINIHDHQRTEVRFRHLDDDEIMAYIASGSPLDKAGAYGIQDDFGAVFVDYIQGCYYNIVGLPVELLYRHLRSLSDAN